ncbi:DUF6907 domain-containing protein [Streptomyces sp. CBMA29]|uniref:DUF6907 domain-containing protein n=1 Tax=Streptomyces sp. CBMA29 TaxID=1896314 RepID=UPI001661C77F|nr:hypothetical protein [Streptomyces sp. CBMA29]MBD0738281.1 hypothetical protein [Streptomyces sp. CBMA29]
MSGEQPRPFSVPGRWTITTPNGPEVSGYLPDWAEDDPSESGVPLDQLPIRLTHIEHRTFFEGQPVSLVETWPGNTAEEEVLLGGSIDCAPYASDPRFRLPVVNIQVCPEHWIAGLDPDGVAEVAACLLAQAELLMHEVRPALIAARKDWEAHRPPRDQGSRTDGNPLFPEPPSATPS